MHSTAKAAAVDRFVEALQALPALPNVFNPWRDHDPEHDQSAEAPVIRAQNLRDYLVPRVGRARLLLVAEAPSYRGAKHTGIAMTCERVLLGHYAKVPPDSVFDGVKRRTSLQAQHPNGVSEPTAGVVWSALLESDARPQEVVLWNAFPCHPHMPGNPLSNRPPTAKELSQYRHILSAMLALMPNAVVVGVGRIAHTAFAKHLNLAVPCVRHPAQGGAALFRTQIAGYLGSAEVTR